MKIYFIYYKLFLLDIQSTVLLEQCSEIMKFWATKERKNLVIVIFEAGAVSSLWPGSVLILSAVNHEAELSVVQPGQQILGRGEHTQDTHLLSPLVSNLEKPSSIWKHFISS